MVDLLAAAVAFTGIVCVALAVLSAVTVLPFLLTLRLADERRFPSARWGAVALVGAVLGLAVGLLVLRSDLTPLLAVLALPLSFLGPLLLSLLEPGQPLGGRSGKHA